MLLRRMDNRDDLHFVGNSIDHQIACAGHNEHPCITHTDQLRALPWKLRQVVDPLANARANTAAPCGLCCRR